TISMSGAGARPFVLKGVPNGEYSVMALSFSPGNDLTLAAPRRIVVKGADVTGIELVLAPITAISGKVVIESPGADDSKSGCQKASAPRVQEMVVAPHSTEKRKTTEIPGSSEMAELLSGFSTTPDAKGEFVAQLLNGGSYHMEADLHDEDLFLN